MRVSEWSCPSCRNKVISRRTLLPDVDKDACCDFSRFTIREGMARQGNIEAVEMCTSTSALVACFCVQSATGRINSMSDERSALLA
jgi:hypothetical protein